VWWCGVESHSRCERQRSIRLACQRAGAGRRHAGQLKYGRRVVRRLAVRTLVALVVLTLVPVVLVVALGLHSLAILAAEVAAIALMLGIDRVIGANLGRRERGNRAEIGVGAILDGMAQGGWLARHDVDTGRGNIDHVAIGPGGLFTVETKSRAGRVSAADLDPAWLRQAYAQRKHVEELIGQQAECLLVLSRAFLDRAPTRQRGVLVLPARMLAGHLNRRKGTLSADKVHAVHRRLVEALDASV
jgi:Nuclease-related domain